MKEKWGKAGQVAPKPEPRVGKICPDSQTYPHSIRVSLWLDQSDLQ